MNAEIKSLSQMVRKPEVIGIPSWEIESLWHKISPILLPVTQLECSDNTLDDVYQFLKAGTMQAWRVNWDVIIVTCKSPYGVGNPPRKLVCQIVFCAGSKMDEWLEHVVNHLNEWRKTQGCHSLRISGRDGWIKTLEPHGFKKFYTTLELV